MSFGTAISGIKAASAGLGIIGNNIANSSTTGFKQSRGEFSDVYAASALGTGGDAIGSGVKLSSVSQQFTQGGINFTNSALDLAINGNGFFALSDGGTTVTAAPAISALTSPVIWSMVRASSCWPTARTRPVPSPAWSATSRSIHPM